jgi:deaminated glutathione amidase
MKGFAIAGIQAPIVAHGGNIAAFLHRIDACMAKFPWVQMIVLSELAAHGPLAGKPEAAGGATESAFQHAAAKHGIWLVPGSYFELASDHAVYNTAPVIDPAGNVVCRYRKMFPFLPYEHGVSYGSEFCTFDVPDAGRFGVSICYDIWFPETSRSLAALGAEVLLHPVLTNTVDRDVEQCMARATAAQFQMYVFDINGLGAGGVGRSCVIDPAGTVLHQAGAGEEIVPIEINFEYVRRQREIGLHGLGQPLKSFRDRKVELAVYDRSGDGTRYWDKLGPLEVQTRGGQTIAPSPAGPACSGGRDPVNS